MPINYEKVNDGNDWDANTAISTSNLSHLEQGVKDSADGVDDIADGTTLTNADQYKGNDIDSDGDGTVDNSEKVNNLFLEMTEEENISISGNSQVTVDVPAEITSNDYTVFFTLITADPGNVPSVYYEKVWGDKIKFVNTGDSGIINYKFLVIS